MTFEEPEFGSSSRVTSAGDPLVARLRAAGCVFAEDEAQLLREAARSGPILEALAERRIGGEPLEYVLGWAEFHGLRIAVEPGVFVPRRRSELLAREAAALAAAAVSAAKAADDGGSAPVVVDLCCGSGAVGAAVASAVPGVELHAADVDPIAVEVARRNVGPFGGQAHAGDLFAALPRSLRGRVSVIAANAPYVPSSAIAFMPPEARDYEPRAALDGGADGLDLQRRVAAGAGEWLAPGGHLLIETSKHQSSGTAALFADAGFSARIVRDPDIGGTVVIGESEALPAQFSAIPHS
ncbi:putative protein N(5)-glutamine methyltransferase [Sinomonas sp. ASV322]|uniref:putative protein N(5)-glutamine methyltransferase n=1 Tax=Sinomonas sp. ASV322 TaxID=3041920 RepID=UPI0027DC5D61|nr:putative protein N(5)-glutamine methyltransferase [Sinomonas sp. ASV322]MDQ4501338.1 putative protein N(5)-glutamine methyltransferase [Sinomonas sp. ASV322]